MTVIALSSQPPVLTAKINDKCFMMQNLRCSLVLLFLLFVYCFPQQGFSVGFEPAIELALIDQTLLRLTEIHLGLPRI